MYCVFNATTMYTSGDGNPLGWPLEKNYGYFCDQRDKGKFCFLESRLLASAASRRRQASASYRTDPAKASSSSLTGS